VPGATYVQIGRAVMRRRSLNWAEHALDSAALWIDCPGVCEGASRLRVFEMQGSMPFSSSAWRERVAVASAAAIKLAVFGSSAQ
jgi:hypothetical protein